MNGLPSFRPGRSVAMSAPIPPPKGDQFSGNDVPGRATRLLAMQQPDKALHFTTPLGAIILSARLAGTDVI